MNRTIRVGAICLAACGLFSPLPAAQAAQQVDENTEAYNLGEVVVSGKTEGVQAAESVYTVTAEDIKSMNATTLDQAISLLPGVNVRVGGEGVPRIDIRGFRTRHVLLLLDGVPLNSAVDAQFDPTTIPTENIAMIKLTAGASSVLYGQGGLGGVINIITKKAAKGVSGMVSAETGDHTPYLVRSSLSAQKDAFNFFISGSSTQVDGFPLSDGFDKTTVQDGDYRKNSDRERHNVLGTIGYNPNEDLSLGFTFNYNQGQYGKPPIIYPKSDFNSDPQYTRVESYEGLSLQLAGDYRITDKLSVRGWAYRNQLHMNENRYSDADYDSFDIGVNGTYKERVRTTIHGVSLQPKYDFGSAGTLTFSTINEWDQWKSDGSYTENKNSPLAKSRDDSKQYSVHTLAAEYEISPLEGLGLVAGYGHHWQAREHSSDNDFSVNAGIHYDVLKDTRLKFSFNRNVRFPSLDDLYNSTKGNEDLKTERSHTFQGGVEQKLPYNSSISLTGFHTVVKDLIQTDKSVTPNISANIDKVQYDGFELATSTRFVPNILLRASYTYLDSDVKGNDGREQLQYTPHDRFTFEGKYDFDFGFTHYFSVQYVANQYYYSKDTPYQKRKLNDFVLLNVKLSQSFFDKKLTTYIGVNNIFDEDYETSYGYPQAGRYIYGGVEFRFGT